LIFHVPVHIICEGWHICIENELFYSIFTEKWSKESKNICTLYIIGTIKAKFFRPG
jgi:hypothetical protein